MLENANFLFELGTEEIPAGYIPNALQSMHDQFEKVLGELLIDYDAIETYGTPRRLVCAISGLAESQREETVEMRGPSVDKAFDDKGEPTKALQGFLRGNGVTVEDIEKRDTGKGIYVFVQKKRETKPTEVLLPDILSDIVHALPFPKKMKWSTKELMFPRPLRYILALFNGSLVPCEIEGITSAAQSRGHYIQHDTMIPIDSIVSYEGLLESHGVLLDQKKRSSLIKEQLQEAAKKEGCVLVDDAELLETVTYLVEDVNVVVCSFEERFLKIPDIVLIAEMKEHQKYFALRNSDGSLANKFCVISNNPATDFIREGNERVIRARFSDAEFFFEEDKKKTLAERVDDLKPVLFHKELGSVYDKVMRIKQIAELISSSLKLNAKTTELISRAVMLSKTDLTTAMVFEFTSLQGQIGRIYAERDGEDPSVAAAIDNHYRPRFHGDETPSDIVSVVLSLSEKIDNIFGSYSVGNIPKGSQDPYALRRQGYAIVDLLIRNELNLDLEEIFSSVKDKYNNGEEIAKLILEFVSVRAKTRFTEDGVSYDEFDAVLATGSTDYYELYNRAMSLHEYRKDDQFSTMLGSFKRMNNILNAYLKKNPDYSFSLDEGALEDSHEKALYDYFASKQTDVESLTRDHEYVKLFEILSGGKMLIDNFFDNVMVVAEDEKLKNARLGLLDWIIQMFARFIDFSKLADHS